MQQKLNQRIAGSDVLSKHVREIGKLLVMDYDMFVLVSARAYKDFAQFHNLYYSYITHVRKAVEPVNRCASFRHYVMNRWEFGMTDIDKHKFRHGFKEVVKGVMKLNRSLR